MVTADEAAPAGEPEPTHVPKGPYHGVMCSEPGKRFEIDGAVYESVAYTGKSATTHAYEVIKALQADLPDPPDPGTLSVCYHCPIYYGRADYASRECICTGPVILVPVQWAPALHLLKPVK